jgi:hypothetical protein
MPRRHDKAAPVFDKSKPQELTRFFEDLEIALDDAKITADADMKKYVVRYVDFNTEQIWKTFEEYKDPTKTYGAFKKAILGHYPDASGEFVYSLSDMDLLIGERQRLGIVSLNDLSNYHLQFIGITAWLIDKKQLGELEQQRAYIRAFAPPLLAQTMNRLQLKYPDHHPTIPYKVKDVYEAAKFILQGSSTFGYNPQASPIPTAPSNKQAPDDTTVKKEELKTILAEFSKGLMEQMLSVNNQISHINTRHNHPPGSGKCNMCGGLHFIRECKLVDEYIAAGKCRRNQEGKVVLPTGAYVSRDIPGEHLRDRIDEWHRRNPNQLAAATLIHTIDRRIVYPDSDTSAPAPQPVVTYQLSKTDRIATLEAELFHLRTKKIAPASNVQTRAQKARAPTVEEEEDEEAIAAAKDRQQIRAKEAAANRQATPQPSANITSTQSDELPVHPYRNARDAVYAPPATKNVGVEDKGTPAIPKKTEPAYKTLPPIHDPAIATNVYKRSMDAQVILTQRELLSLSPEVRSQFRDSTTTRRIAAKDKTTQNYYQVDEEYDDDYPAFPQTIPEPPVNYVDNFAYFPNPPKGAIVVPDPIEAYYRSLHPGEEPDPDQLIVAAESGAVRSVLALIDNTQKKECILDPGCQIIAMSETTCHDLGLAYDPTIKLHMQSANGNINQSLGLSRNVPFQLGSITLYLQVHVIRSPAYEVLLGRPFDILTESIVRNFANEDQTITIHDPNTGRRVTIPTFPRSIHSSRCPHHKKQDFR